MSNSRYTDGEHWLPNDDRGLPQPTIAITADGGGSVVVDMLNGGKKVKLFLSSDNALRVAATKIYTSGTTAKNITVFYAEDTPFPEQYIDVDSILELLRAGEMQGAITLMIAGTDTFANLSALSPPRSDVFYATTSDVGAPSRLKDGSAAEAGDILYFDVDLGWQNLGGIQGEKGEKGDPGDAASSLTGAQIAAALDVEIGSGNWRRTLTNTEVVAAIDVQLGTTTWKDADTVLTQAQVVAAIDSELGNTTWQTQDGAPLTPSQVIAMINAVIGNTDWQTQDGAPLTASEVVSAVSSNLGNTDWQSGGGILTGAQIVAAIDAELSNDNWQTQDGAPLTTAQIIAAIDGHIGSTDWQTQDGAPLTAAQVVAAIDAELGSTNWKTSYDALFRSGQVFADTTERDAYTANEGLICITIDTDTYYKYASNAWAVYTGQTPLYMIGNIAVATVNGHLDNRQIYDQEGV